MTIGHEKVSSLNTAKTLTVPTGASVAWVQAVTNNVRYTLDGSTTPTSSVGQVLYAGHAPTVLHGEQISNFKGIETASSATLEVHYFG